MTPKQLSKVKVFDEIIEVGTGRKLTAIFVHRYDAGDATIIAVTEPERFVVTIGAGPIMRGTKLVREYVGEIRLKVSTKDPTLTHFSNAEIIGATNAHRWEVAK